MKNQNIKAVIFSKTCMPDAKSFSTELKERDVFVFSSIQECTIPFFHCIFFGSRLEEIEEAKGCGIRTVAVGKAELADEADAYVDSYEEIDLGTMLESGRMKPMPIVENCMVEEGFSLKDISHMASLFSLGNGYMGLRATFDEVDEGTPQAQGMYLNGIFATEDYRHIDWFVGYAKQNEYTVNLADWRIINLYIDGEKACFSAKNIKEHTRILNMQNGQLIRRFIFETKSGKRASVESVRIVNMDEVHGAQIRYRVEPLNFSGRVDLELMIEKCTKTGPNTPCTLGYEEVEQNLYSFTQRVTSTGQQVATAICHKVTADNYQTKIVNCENIYSYNVTSNVEQGQCITVEKYAAFTCSMDGFDNLLQSARELALCNAADGFDALSHRQAEFWEDYWKKADVKIKGNPADAQAVKFSLFQLRCQLATVNACSIGATGLTGPGYSGKVFWDTEMYLMPYYNFTYPETQKELLMYRYRILDKAKERAKEFGLSGAMYAWCSIDGLETSTVFEASTAEYHLQSDVAYAVWRYVDSTNDKEFLYQYGAEIVLETAKFMYRRGCFIEANGGRFCVNVVCGPDEYACGVNNNCYTNLMLQFHLNYAVAVVEEMKQNVPELYAKLSERIELSDDEPMQWKKAADLMYYKYNEELGIHEQDDSFVRNDPVDMSTIPMNKDIRGMYHPLDLWRKQVSKQADVVLINFVRGNLFTADEKLRNYEYYEPRCNHGSSLSTAIHAIMACELGKPEAYEFFRCSAYMDIGDFKHNTGGGLHVACLGGVWMAVVNGYLGMRHYEDGIHFCPHLPSAWEGYELHFTYKGATMKITVSAEQTVFELTEGDSLQFFVGEDAVLLTNENPQFVCNTDCIG